VFGQLTYRTQTLRNVCIKPRSAGTSIYLIIIFSPALVSRLACGQFQNSDTFNVSDVMNDSLAMNIVRFQVLTAASMMFRAVFWVILPCRIIVDRRFRGAYCLHLLPCRMIVDRRFRGAYRLHLLPCRMIVDRRFRGTYCLHHQDDGGSTHL
jgi:hypothetical protein